MRSQPEQASLAARMHAVRQSLLRRLRELTGRHARYQRLFGGTDGALSPDGAAFFAEVARLGRVGEPIFTSDPHELARRAGAHDLAIKLMSGLELDGARLAALTRRLQETNDE